MTDLDDDAVTVTLPAEEGGAVIEKIADKIDPKIVADDPIADLRGQFEQMKGTLNQTTQRLVGAERDLDTTRQELANSRQEVTTSQMDTVLSGIQAANAEAEAAEREHTAAFEAGDGPAQARAFRKMAAAEARIQRLKEAEGDLKEQSTAKQPVRQEQRQQPVNDPVETFTKGMSPKSAAWIRSHPECVTDAKKNARMLAAHNLALADDVTVDSDEYFQRIEAGITPKAAAKIEADLKPEPKVNIRPSAPVAPAGSGSGGGAGGQSVTLTRREVESATDGTLVWNYSDPGGKFKKGDVIGVQEMGRRKILMKQQGLYDKTLDSQ